MKKTLWLLTILGLLTGGAIVYAHSVWGIDPANLLAERFVPASSQQIVSPLAESPAVLGVVEQTDETAQKSLQPEIGQPQTISIPKIGVEATVEHVGLDEEQRMDVPSLDENTGWYKYGPKPGELGSSVIAGHLDTRQGGEAVFFKLADLQPGDEIKITDDTGQVRTFVVIQTQHYPDNAFPIDTVFGNHGTARLNLITCAGQFDQTAKNYQDRLVVFSQLKDV